MSSRRRGLETVRWMRIIPKAIWRQRRSIYSALSHSLSLSLSLSVARCVYSSKSVSARVHNPPISLQLRVAFLSIFAVLVSAAWRIYRGTRRRSKRGRRAPARSRQLRHSRVDSKVGFKPLLTDALSTLARAALIA